MESKPTDILSATHVSLHEPAKLRIVIVTENIMPQVDGVTRCLARLLSHLKEEGHSVVVLGPQSGMSSYETYPLLGTAGIPIIQYPGYKLNFLRPLFLRTICEFVRPNFRDGFFILLMQNRTEARCNTCCRTRLARGTGDSCNQEWVVWKLLGWEGEPNRGVISHKLANVGFELFTLPKASQMSKDTCLCTVCIGWNLSCGVGFDISIQTCPSNSTVEMLHGRGFCNTRLWPRGVNLDVFNPAKRSTRIRQSYGVVYSEPEIEMNFKSQGPVLEPTTFSSSASTSVSRHSNDSVVILSVGRICYEKNLVLLVHAFALLLARMSRDYPKPRLVFVGDGPARQQLELLAQSKGVQATFVGHVGDPERLAEYYASADIFAFPSFTETFGQVICEALASGLPVVGLDAPGTRDLVVDDRTGFLLRKPDAADRTSEWNSFLTDFPSVAFDQAAVDYSHLLGRLVFDRSLRISMSRRAVKEGVVGRSWSHAMDAIVACYREAITMSTRERLATPSDPPARPRLRIPHYLFLATLFIITISFLTTYWTIVHS